MIALNPGRFRMGRRTAGPTSDARPAHEVAVDAFLIGAHEVTFDDYDRYVRATGARRPSDYGHGRGNRPVLDVSWDDARAYAAWLSRQTGQRYRLPTEAEWEYAARAGTTSAYWWGSTGEGAPAVCFNCGSARDRRPAPVGSFPPNPFGLHDTAGNALEWVADCYRPNYNAAPADGRAVDEPGCPKRVARGGSYRSPVASLRSDRRQAFPPDTRSPHLGFRVARDG
jgi:formylglycine-generating enzyme required for sulfatase activity